MLIYYLSSILTLYVEDRRMPQLSCSALTQMATVVHSNHVELAVAFLPADALRKVFSCLDSRSLCICSCVSHAWNSLAVEGTLWQQQLASEFYRPAMLLHYGLLGTESVVDIAASRQPLEHTADVQGTRTTTLACEQQKQAFISAMAHPASQHQATLARFHTAMHNIHAWRLMITIKDVTETLRALTLVHTKSVAHCRAYDHLKRTAAGPAVGSGPMHHTNSSSSGNIDELTGMLQEVCVDVTTAQGNGASSSSSSVPSSSSSTSRPIGHPQKLHLLDVAVSCASGWCIGCVEVQVQEQSCWIRFNLPSELKNDRDICWAAETGRLAAVVQALGPTGWFDVASCDPFKIENDDMDILLQSHKTGFYAWDQAEEDSPDRHSDAEPLPWDLTTENWQQHLQQHTTRQQQCNLHKQQQQQRVGGSMMQQQQQAALGLVAQQQYSSGQTVQQLLHSREEASQQQQQEVESDQQQLQQPGPKLRMLVYIHYEQLLPMLPWQLPQTLPILTQPTLCTMSQVGQALARSPDAALWLHVDVCQLHGGYRLGSCIAPLRFARMGAEKIVFEAHQDSVLVALYDPESCRNSSTCSPRTALPGQHTEPPDQQQPVGQLLDDEACRLLLLGKHCLGGSCGSSSSKGVYNSEGLLIQTAADALGDLMGRDEVMVDFSLFDGKGHLLMGRAGVEVWSKECTSYHAAAQTNAQPVSSTGPSQLAAALHAAEPVPLNIVHSRTLHMLHFLVDDVDSLLWENGITVDAARAPDGVNVALLSMALTWKALMGLFMKQQGLGGGGSCERDEVGSYVCAVGKALLGGK